MKHNIAELPAGRCELRHKKRHEFHEIKQIEIRVISGVFFATPASPRPTKTPRIPRNKTN
jgi:hypothetical protein